MGLYGSMENLHKITDGRSCQKNVVLLTSEQKWAKDVIDAKKREIENMEIHKVDECVPNIGQKHVLKKNGWLQRNSRTIRR